jgi:hypothetical protein
LKHDHADFFADHEPRTRDETPLVPGQTRYHWWVLVVGSMAWLFDTMDQRIFILARGPALAQLLGVPPTDQDVVFFGRIVTALMMLGWAVGGIFFGTLATAPVV